MALQDEERPLLADEQRDPHPYLPSHSQVNSQVISQDAFRTTPARWYILFAFCYMGMIQGFIGNSWGPIATVMENQFSWDDSRIALLAMWMSLFFIPGAMLFPVLMEFWNMRIVVLLNTLLMAAAGVLKILSVTVISIDYLISISHITQIINGFCGAVPFSGVMFITVNWFPTKERLIATGVIMASLNFGIGVAFLLGPGIVPDYTNSTVRPHLHSLDTLNDKNFMLYDANHSTGNHTHQFYHHRLQMYLCVQGMSMIVCFILCLIYFPARPKYAPTASAVTARLNMKQGLKILLTKGNFWLIVVIYALTSGVFNGYGLTMDVILKSNDNISQQLAGYVGFAALLASVPSNLFIGALGAIFNKHQKAINTTVLIVGTIFMVAFVLILMNFMEWSTVMFWICVVLGVSCITGVVPILFDMSTESSHPVGEELSSTIMVLGNQLMCDVFTAIIQLKFNKMYLNYVLIMCFATACFLSFFYRPSNVRLLIDYHSITVEQLDTRSIQQIRNALAHRP